MDNDLQMPPEPGHRPPAPDPLRLIQRFLNTRDVEEGVDALDSPGALDAWLGEMGLADDGRASAPDDLERATALREAIRAFLASRSHAAVTSPAASLFKRATVSLRFSVAASTGGYLELVPASTGPGRALGTIVAVLLRADADGSLERLKVCTNERCRWAYWDGSRNRSGTWCTMAVCGNRVKGRAFRQRTAGRVAPPRWTTRA